MLTIIIELLLVSIPVIFAGIFHMIVVKYNWFSFLCYPLDHYKMINGKRIFGNNKTYRGAVILIITSIIFTYTYFLVVNQFSFIKNYNLLDFNNYSFTFYGILFGIGYILGELPNSFIKRQKNMKPGKANSLITKIIDQLDSVVCILILLLIFSNLTWVHFIIGIFFFGFLHLIINLGLNSIGLRKEPF